MVDIPTVACPRCSAKVHSQKDRCQNCGLPLTPKDSSKPPLRGRAPRAGSR